MSVPPVDFGDDGDMKKTVKQVAGTVAGAAAVALLPIEAPIVAVAAVTVGVGIVAAKTVGAIFDFFD